MATLKRPLARDGSGQRSSLSAPGSPDPMETITKRVKRNSNNNNEEDRDNVTMHTMSFHHPIPHSHLEPSIYRQEQTPPNASLKHPEDQDDETLIRETQAALKSLSGGWSNAAQYKVTEPEPAFQNLFEESKPADGSGKGITKPEYTTPHQNSEYSSYYKESTLKPQPRVKEERRQQRIVSQYPTHDFTELVEDSMNDLDPAKPDHNSYSDYTQQHSHRTMFSESSAFRPLGKAPIHHSQHPPTIDPTAYGIYQETGAPDLLDHPDLPATADQESRHNELVHRYIKEEEERQRRKALGSPDSKHYTILQPAGIGSMAATVMEGAARDGVVSVSAVTSTSSPELGNMRLRTGCVEQGGGVCEMRRAMPEFSPGSVNRGE